MELSDQLERQNVQMAAKLEESVTTANEQAQEHVSLPMNLQDIYFIIETIILLNQTRI